MRITKFIAIFLLLFTMATSAQEVHQLEDGSVEFVPVEATTEFDKLWSQVISQDIEGLKRAVQNDPKIILSAEKDSGRSLLVKEDLMAAAPAKTIAIWKFLLHHGADPNLPVMGRATTALHQSMWPGDIRAIELLLSKDCDAKVKNDEDQTALEMKTPYDSTPLEAALSTLLRTGKLEKKARNAFRCRRNLCDNRTARGCPETESAYQKVDNWVYCSGASHTGVGLSADFPRARKQQSFLSDTQTHRQCKENLGNLATALAMYHMDNEESYPDNLGILAPNYLAEKLSCPASFTPSDYTLVVRDGKAFVVCQADRHPDQVCPAAEI